MEEDEFADSDKVLEVGIVFLWWLWDPVQIVSNLLDGSMKDNIHHGFSQSILKNRCNRLRYY
jgi:hypothetical protein